MALCLVELSRKGAVKAREKEHFILGSAIFGKDNRGKGVSQNICDRGTSFLRRGPMADGTVNEGPGMFRKNRLKNDMTKDACRASIIMSESPRGHVHWGNGGKSIKNEVYSGAGSPENHPGEE